jgi:hypothetical protein
MHKTLGPLALFVTAVSFTIPAAADEPLGPIASGGAAMAPVDDHGLGKVHGGLKTDSARTAGSSRDVATSASAASAKTPRPAATPRVLRRLGLERALAAVDPDVRACAGDNPSILPAAMVIRISIGANGQVEDLERMSPTYVADALAACVNRALGVARFGAPGIAATSVVVPITVPGRPATTTTTTVTKATPAPSATAPAATPPPPPSASSDPSQTNSAVAAAH